jgi:Rne/Rng family ribonuclease
MPVKQLLISLQTPRRAALVDDGRLEELHVLHAHTAVGNIYRAKVVRMVPDLEAAFVDIGASKHAMLHISGVYPTPTSDPAVAQTREAHEHAKSSNKRRQSISDLLHPDQGILVQVVKPPREHRGSVVEMFLSIPGRYLVLTAGLDTPSIARTISDQKERRRLTAIIRKFSCPQGIGIMVRQSAVGRTAVDLQADLSHLLALWEEIADVAVQIPRPVRIHP